MTLGPLEYILIGFEGNRFTGQILLVTSQSYG